MTRRRPDVVRRLAEIEEADQQSTEALVAAQGEAQALRGATLRKADLLSALDIFISVYSIWARIKEKHPNINKVVAGILSSMGTVVAAYLWLRTKLAFLP